MPSYLVRRVALQLAVLVTALCAPSIAWAQSRLTGTILSAESRAPIPGAVVAVPALARSATTDSTGRFALDGITGGEVFVLVRAVGFRPDTTLLDFAAAEVRERDILLAPIATALDEVRVTARQPEYRGKLAAFDERRAFGIGRFIDSTHLDGQRHRRTADLIATETAGVRIIRGPSGDAYLASNRMSGPRAILGGANQRCFMDVWLDGALLADAGAGSRFDVNSINPETIAAIEVYVGPSQVPMRYNKTGSACGVTLIWTR